MLRREDGHGLRRALDFEVEGQRKKGRSKEERKVKGRKEGQRRKGRPKRTWKKQVDKECATVGLRMKDAHYRSKWSVGVNLIAAGLR